MTKARTRALVPGEQLPGAIVLFAAAYLAAALAGLREWGSPQPWSRVDAIAVVGLLLSVLVALEQACLAAALPRSDQVRREAFGMTYDPAMGWWMAALALAEQSVFLDYAHWRLAPPLHATALRAVGLALYALAVAWVAWVDSYLVRHFTRADAGPRTLIEAGPFRAVRHPRYAGLLASRVAFALVFGSVVAWLLVPGWITLVRRRILREEGHLEAQLGPAYEAYERRTPRLLPWIY
jgi:protein-S-isoprenylcysteine O-methyltransferase Ste14